MEQITVFKCLKIKEKKGKDHFQVKMLHYFWWQKHILVVENFEDTEKSNE